MVQRLCHVWLCALARWVSLEARHDNRGEEVPRWPEGGGDDATEAGRGGGGREQSEVATGLNSGARGRGSAGVSAVAAGDGEHSGAGQRQSY